MARVAWDDRFFATTRGSILLLLRKGNQTVDDLAAALTLSDNAIRSHLYALERDGFVVQQGVRRGAGKPAWVYALAPAADRIFPKPYGSVLETLLQVLGEHLPAEQVDEALVEAGRRLASNVPPLTGPLEQRLPAVVDAITNIGGMAEIDTSERRIVIRGYDCPLSQAVKGYPDSCRVLQSLLETLLDHPVVEQCDRGDPPRCCFAVANHDNAPGEAR